MGTAQTLKHHREGECGARLTVRTNNNRQYELNNGHLRDGNWIPDTRHCGCRLFVACRLLCTILVLCDINGVLKVDHVPEIRKTPPREKIGVTEALNPSES